MKKSIIRWTLSSCAAMLLVASAHAATITANITYAGTSGTAANGTGSLTVTDGLLTAFSLVENVGAGPAVYTYGLADIATFSNGNTGATTITGANGLVFTLTTLTKAGSPNTFGNSAFTISFGASNPGSGANFGGNLVTGGNVTLSAPTTSAVPEPGTLSLVGLGAAALFALRRRQLRS